jgi:hypothetical protein
MLSNLANSLYVRSGTAFLTLLTWIRWPKIRLRMQSQNHNGIHVTDIMLCVSSQGRRRDDDVTEFETALYWVIKRKE